MNLPRRITSREALELFDSPDLLSTAIAADAVRQKIHPEGIVTYIVDRNINYTNLCVSRCKFCAFHNDYGYVISKDELADKIDETVKLGGTQILLQGGLHPRLPIEFYEDMLRFIKKNFKIHIHAFSPPEICHFVRLNKLDIKEVIKRLISAGLDSIPGGGAEILVDKIRKKVSPKKCSSSEWLDVMRTAHKMKISTTATMMFGFIESYEDRISHLQKIRALQDETGGFKAFIPWTFQPGNTRLSHLTPSDGVDYLKTLAISRIFLDNIKNIQASWVTQGPKIAQVALRFGANDIGSTMIEENVVASTGVSFRLCEDELLRLITDAGFKPVKRALS